MSGRWLGALSVTFILGLAVATAGPKDKSVVKGDTVDVSKIGDWLKIGHDGNGNYIAALPLGNIWELYFGNGKTFYKQRVFGGGSNGAQKSANWSFWSPREFNHGSLSFKNNTYVMECGSKRNKNERAITFNLLSENDRNKLVAKAKFKTLPFKRTPLYLMRNNKGIYYFVDKASDGAAYKLYVGRRGNLKPYKLVDIVDDSEGMIFITKKGELRLNVDKDKKVAEWTKGRRKDDLKNVPVRNNRLLIYNELGVYSTVKLGTPCENL